MKKITIKTALFISIGLICIDWLQTIIETIFEIPSIAKFLKLNLGESLPLTSIYILINGTVVFLIVYCLLRLSGEKLGELGFNRLKLGKQIMIGALFGLIICIIDLFLLSPIFDSLFPQSESESSLIQGMFSNIYFFPIWIFISIFKGGFIEELWRIFVLTRFEKVFKKLGLVFALIIGSITFGLGHAYQGTSAIFTIAIIGFLYALVYLRKRNAVEAVTAHAVFDLIMITLGFIIYSSQ
ncbi:MAG: hypothetical protein A2V66_00225 [Ignavibacteria bacterium RBG_13_36_8]|nr:MAG: hypothetical protein A2V66_00225 [Ignavibacteria bacterium RBG_13_36_8]